MTHGITIDRANSRGEYLNGLDTAAKSGEQRTLQPVLRLRPHCAGITFLGRVDFVMKTIALTQGKHAMVDDEDYEFLNQWKWRALKGRRKQTKEVWYAQRTTARPNRKGIYMHREVLRRAGFEIVPQCDHEDADGLNNQRNNLRTATSNQNHWNRRKRAGCTSQFKGVYWHKNNPIGWMARIYCKGKYHFLGMFSNETDAAKAYDVAALRLFGQFAHLNFK